MEIAKEKVNTLENVNDYRLTLFLCLVIHSVILPVFIYYRAIPMIIMDGISVCIYLIGCLVVGKMEKKSWWISIYALEVTVFCVVCNLSMGAEGGFSLYGTMMTLGSFFLMYEARPRRDTIARSIMFTSMGMVGIFFSHIYAILTGINRYIPELVLDKLFLLNLFWTGMITIYISGRFIGLVEARESTLRRKNRELDHKAHYDDLTGELNRRGFYIRTQETLRLNPEVDFVLLVTDIKDFKLVNSLFGDETGNQILKTQAASLHQYMKYPAVVGRLGADRFALLIPQERYQEQQFVELIQRLQKLYSTNHYQLHLHIGVYEVHDWKETIGAMCDKAILAIGSIKDDVQKTVAYYDHTVLQNEISRQQMIGEFDEALRQGQFQMVLQPQADREGHVRGSEALVRWNHPEKGLLMPGVFIKHFEDSGLISRLDAYMWETAVRKLRSWIDMGKENMYISVNISVKDFYYMDVYETITGLIQKYDIPVKMLHLEITETVIVDKTGDAQNVIRKLYEYGFVMEIDDFGSGYSSLRFLKDAYVQVVKIDREFLAESWDSRRSRSILEGIIDLAHGIGMELIAEGVEREEQFESLVGMGCDCFQGYYFSKPIPVPEFEKKYLSERNV